MAARAEKEPRARQTLRATDQESARVVSIHRDDGFIVGAGCLVDSSLIITCRHVVQAALGTQARHGRNLVGASIFASLLGVTRQPTVRVKVAKVGGRGAENDLAALRIPAQRSIKDLIEIQSVEFASPLRHAGKRYSVLGFPGGDPQGRNAVGRLHAADANGLVQMDRGGALSVLGGFSGAPVWSSDLSAFVGLVVRELSGNNVSWCIPSRRLCEFHPQLAVRFRIPPKDRPVIHDWSEDDPNIQLFGALDDDGHRRLRAAVRKKRRDDYVVDVYYEIHSDAPAPRGRFVTFITYPDFKKSGEDAYELFAELEYDRASKKWIAWQRFKPEDLFTVAAIGDAGDTVLTLNLEKAPRRTRPKNQ